MSNAPCRRVGRWWPISLLILLLTPPSSSSGTEVALGGSEYPVVAVNPTNPLNIAYASRNEMRVSTDGGATFGSPVFCVTPTTHQPGAVFLVGVAGASCCLAFDSQGRLFWTYQGFLQVSGVSGGDDVFLAQCNPATGAILPGYPVNVTAAAGLPASAGHDNVPAWLAADVTSGSFQDRIYLTWVRWVSGGTRIHTSYSTDQGQAWSNRLRLDGSDLFEGYKGPVHVATAPNGDVYVAYHSELSSVSEGVFVLRSTDGGVSFPQKTMAYAFGQANTAGSINVGPASINNNGSEHPWVLADPLTAGRIYVVATEDPDGTSPEPSDVLLAISTDHGVTWAAPGRIDGGPTNTMQIMPAAAIDPVSGMIAVHYYDNRSGNVNADGVDLLDLYMTVSRDAGATFLPDFRISAESFDLVAGGNGGGAPGLWDVWGTSGSDVLAVGAFGTIQRYDGVSWSADATGTSAFLFGVGGSSSSDVFAVGGAGAILHYDGVTWSTQASGVTTGLQAVWASGPGDAVAVGDAGTILRWNGLGWLTESSGTTEPLEGVWGSSATDAFAVGGGGTILHYDGFSWQPQPSGTTENLRGVFGISGSDVFAVGDGGGVYHYDGSAWSLHSSLGTPIFDVWASSASDVFATGARIHHFDGVTWQEFPHVVRLFFGVWGSGPGDVFAVSPINGQILHYEGSSWSSEEGAVAGQYFVNFNNGVAVAGDVACAVWVGNWAEAGAPVSQQSMFTRVDLDAVGAPQIAAAGGAEELMLLPGWPNPFRGSTLIGYVLPAAGQARLAVYDVQGRRITTLLDEPQAAGRHSLTWDGRGNHGNVASGIYFVRLTDGRTTETRKVVLQR